MDIPYQPRGIGFDALDELNEVDWGVLEHAFGRGVVAFGAGDHSLDIAGNVARSLAELRSDPSHAIGRGLYSNVCHQGTVYQATAYAVPFIVAVAVGDVPDDLRVELVALIGNIAIGASYQAPNGSHAGAVGREVDGLVTRALAASIDRLMSIRTPNLQVLIADIRSLLADATEERRDAIDSALESLSSPAAS